MAYLGANSSQHVDEFLQSLQQYIRQVGFFVCPVVLFSLRMFVTHSLIFIVISDQSNGPGAGFSHICLSVCPHNKGGEWIHPIWTFSHTWFLRHTRVSPLNVIHVLYSSPCEL